jgi:3-hydroxyisobutyrate dehydrogenase-like beta-hydroxyacid dehydrogenase
MKNEKTKVGVIGLGIMGHPFHPICRSLGLMCMALI